MNNELLIKIGSENHKVFLQDGFYYPSSKATPFHTHNYAEIHVISGTDAFFNIGDNVFPCEDGNLIIIPRGIFHSFAGGDTKTVHIGFQIDCDIKYFSSYSINRNFIKEFISEIKKNRLAPDYTAISAYITMLCAYCGLGNKIQAYPISDYGFLIREFFMNHYNEDLHLCDLANELNLSERQAERLVIKHTGNTFGEELTLIRLNIAKQLIKAGGMSLTEIADYIGYRSYAGFWKAMKKAETAKKPV